MLRRLKLFEASRKFLGLCCMALLATSCGSPVSGMFGDFTSAQFFGAGKITPNSDGTWTLWWPMMSISEGVTYDVFQVKSGEPFNFDEPVTNVAGNTYQTSDLRIVGNTCFVVRALQNGEKVDTNTKEICTNHEPYSFAGIKELVSLKDGTYMIRWDAPPFAGGVFQVLSRKKNEKELTPLGMSEQSFFQTGKIPLSDAVCFAVQHRIQGFPDDTNMKELCTTEEQVGGFSGIVGYTLPAQGAIKLWWSPSSRENVLSYRVYLGASFQRPIALLKASEVCKEQTFNGEKKVWCSFEQTGLPHAASYTYGVRAVDVFEREDDNAKAITIELSNHQPIISFVKVESSTEAGRPTSVTCSTDYADSDLWQKVVPTIVFKNRKREQVGDVELQRATLPAGTKSASYTLLPDDRHGDVIVCQVSLDDGFGGSHIMISAPAEASAGIGTSYLIPDTPAIATSIKDTESGTTDFVYGVKNLAREITVSLNSGYSDLDSDPAANIIITNVTHGNVCLLSDTFCSIDAIGNWSSAEKSFPCQSDGTCKFQFIPKKDHFTDPAALTSTLAVVEYKIQVGDIILPDGTKSDGSISPTTGSFRVNVRPAPRATGFTFFDGQQDKDYLLESTGHLDSNGDPLDNGRFLDKDKLAAGVLKGFTPNTRWMGYESNLPILKMYTRIALNASDQPTERPNGSFNEDAMAALGETVKCSEETFFENESADTNKERKVLTNCEIQCRAPTEAEVREIYSRRGGVTDATALANLLSDTKLRICPFIFKPKTGFYGTSVFYYSVVDQNGLPSEYARAEINFSPSLRAVGHTITVVEGENAPIEFMEQPEDSMELTGFDGSSPPDVVVSSVEVKDSQIRYGDIFQTFTFACDEANNTCSANAGALSAGGSWPGYGRAYYTYRMRGLDSKNGNSIVTSNWCPAQTSADPAGCKAEIHYYPKPRATTASFAVLEDSNTLLSIEAGEMSSARGYHHPYGDQATVLKIKGYDNTRGTIVELSSAPTGDVSCSSGSCPFTVNTGEDPCSGSWATCSINIDYSVVTRAGSESELPTTPVDKRNIESAPAAATVAIRPVPKPNNLSFLKSEGESFVITITNGVQGEVNGDSGGYVYPLGGIVAKSVQVIGTIPHGGGLIGGGFTCNNISCTATYVPGAGFTGITAFDFKVTVFDPVMNKDVQSSSTGTVNITVRPVPKATGLMGVNRVIAVEGIAQDFKVKFGIAGELIGYTHAEGIPAQSVTTIPNDGTVAQTSNSEPMGLVADRGGGVRFVCSPSTKNCEATFSPRSFDANWPGYGEGKFRYTVSVNDPQLGVLTSTPADAVIEVRPAPRAIGDQTAPNGPPQYVTVEGSQRTFSISFGNGYTHPYNTRASDLLIKGVQNGIVTNPQCNSDGVCSFTFEPDNSFTGDALITYAVRVSDPSVNFEPFNGKIESAQTTTKVLVYPRPKATGQALIALQNKVKAILIEPNTTSNNNKGGYEHPYGDKAFCVKVSNSRNGSVSNFSCNTAGKCSADFTPTMNFYSATVDDLAGFDYNVYVQKDGVPNDTVGLCPDGVTGRPLVGSNTGTVDINVRPIPVATGLTVVKKQGETFVIELKSGDTNGYKDLATPARNASSAEFTGPAVPSTAGTFTAWNCTANPGVCSTTFTPAMTSGGAETAYFGDLQIPYSVFMFDADINASIQSDPAYLTLRLRPLPVATAVTATVKQGQNHPIELTTTPTTSPTYTHPYDLKAYRVEFRELLLPNDPNLAQNGTLKDTGNNIGFSCNTASGRCESTFFPAQSSGEYYWGDKAGFEYRVVVLDEVLADATGNGDVESSWKPYTIEYRPVPVATGLASTLYLKEGSTKQVLITWGSPTEKKGYAHGGPSFHLPPHSVTATPAMGAIGTLSSFECDSASETCSATYTSPSSGTLYGPAVFNYRVAVNDPKLGILESYNTHTIELEVKPIPKTAPKALVGVQGVPKVISLVIGSGYSYPAELLPSLNSPKISVETTSVQNSSLSEFSCDETSGACVATITPNSGFIGVGTFQFKVTVYDPQLGELASNSSQYSVDFYPTPIAIPLLQANSNHILGKEGENKTFDLLPSKLGDGGLPTFCNSFDATRGFPKGYSHPLCSPAVEILVDAISLSNATVPSGFECETDGVCTGTVIPNAVGGSWNGYGLASFNYRVRIDPEVLKEADLSLAERAALISPSAMAQIEFKPTPKTRDLQLWAVEDFQMVQTISRCNDSLIEDCDLGYVQGYNENASQVTVSNSTQLAIAGPFSCDAAGICTGVVKPQAGYYSSQLAGSTDRATLDFKVKVEDAFSNVSKLIYNVYPRPRSLAKSAEGVQNEELDITFAPNDGYSHVESGQATKLNLMAPEGGVFLQTANCVDFDAVNNSCRSYACTSGVCVARFRQGKANQPFADFWGSANAYFRVEMDGPAGLPNALKPGLVSDWTEMKIKILPKPVAGNIEIVVKENEDKAFAFSRPTAYTHPLEEGEPSKIILPNNPAVGSKIPVYNASSQEMGNLAEVSFPCGVGSCSNVFKPGLDVYGTATLNFKVEVSGDARLVSDNVGIATFDIRPVPDAVNTALVYEVEGENHEFELGHGNGFYHPYHQVGTTEFAPKNLVTSNLVNGTLGSWVEQSDGMAKNTFTPSPSWIPDATNNKASFLFSLSVNDPKLGQIESAPTKKGKFEVEYRPKPRSQSVAFKGVENSNSSFVIALNAGYTHAHNLKASEIEFSDLSNAVEVSKECSVSTGDCTTVFQPNANYYGNVTAKFRVKIADTLLPAGKQELWSDWSNLTIDVRPLPKTSSLILKGAQNTNNELQFGIQKAGAPAYTVAYSHPYFAESEPNIYVAKSIRIHDLASGSFSGTGVSLNTGIYTIPCNAAGVCAATYTPQSDFTGVVNFKHDVIIHDPVLQQDLTSALSNSEYRVRPVPIAQDFSIKAAEAKTGEQRTATIQFGLSTNGFAYPFVPIEQIADVTVVDDSALNGTLTSFSCSAGICTTQYQPFAGYHGPASFTFNVWVDDDEIGMVSSATTRTVSIEVRPRPTIAAFSKEIAENIADHPTTTTVQIQLDNAENKGYKQLNALKAFAITTPSAAKGTVNSATCDNATGVCTVTFTPAEGEKNTDASFAYTVKVEDPVLGDTQPANVLESDVGVITLPIRARPVANSITVFAEQGSSPVVTIDKPAGYTHSLYNANGVVVIGWDNTRINSMPSFSCDGGTCSATVVPKSNSILGEASISYQVKVNDTVLGITNYWSNTAVAKVVYKAVPLIAGSPHSEATLENTPIQINFSRGNKYNYDDNTTWDDVKGTIKVTISGADKGTFDDGATEKQYSCNASGTCSITYNPTSGQYGLDELTYSVSLTDPDLGTVTSATTGTINLKIRPRPHANNVAVRTVYQNVSGVTANEGADLTFTAGTEFTYAYLSSPNEFENLRIAATTPVKGSFYNGTALVTSLTNSCVSGVCTVRYVPTQNQIDGASFNYKIIVFDKVLNQDVESVGTAVSALDIYPRPVCNPITVFSTQGENATVQLDAGATKGYTHARGHLASSARLLVGTTTNGTVTPSDVTCVGGKCDFSFVPPSAAFYTSEDLTTTVANFDFNVSVGGTDAFTPCKATVVFRPKPIAEPPTGLFVFEGQQKLISLAKSGFSGGNSGYFHPWTGANGKATAIQISSFTRGTVDSNQFECTSGSCTKLFNPSIATSSTDYGAGKASITYSVSTGASPYDVTSADGTIQMNLRPVPKVQNINLKMIENTPQNFQVGVGQNGYVWGVAGLTQVEPAGIETVKIGDGFGFNPTFSCSGSAPCQANLTTTSNFSRGTTNAVASFRYRVKTLDTVSGEEVWSHLGASNTWATVTVDVAPRPRATNRTFTDGRSGMPLNIELTRGSGYTHVQNFNAASITVDSCDNCASTPTFDCSSPGSNGRCTATLTPKTSFTSISGEPNPPGEASAFNHTGKDFGWARLSYSVTVSDSAYGGNVSSPSNGTIWVYFRPVPKTNPYFTSTPLVKNDAVEGEDYLVGLTENAGWNYGRSPARKPTQLHIANVSAGTVTSQNCSSGVCNAIFSSPTSYPTFGALSFDYHIQVSDADNVAVSSAEKTGAGPGRVTVQFKARPRLQDIGNDQLVASKVVSGYALESCKADGTHDTLLRPEFEISKAAFNAGTGAPTQTTGYYHWQGVGPQTLTVMSNSESNGQVVANSCDGTTCTVKWQPRCWNEGENQVTGQFQFKVTDSNGHLSKGNAATATIVAIPRLKTTNRSYPKGDATQGIVGQDKTVEISAGASSGYTHALSASGKYATKIKIVGGTGFTSPAVNSELGCGTVTAGTCTFNITPSVADSTAKIEYQVGDADGFVSHNKGTLEVYFASKPVSTTVNQVVAQGSTNNTLTISLGAGYTHPVGDKATSIEITQTSALNAAAGTTLTNTSFVCSNGTCTANYTPNPAYSSAENAPAYFKYKVKIGSNLVSDGEGTYNIDVYPKPTVRDQSHYWVQGLGRWEDGVDSADRYKIDLSKGPAPAAYTTRGGDVAFSIEEATFLSGTGTWNQGFICSGGGTCTAKLQPSASLYSTTQSSAALRVSYKVRVRKDNVNIDSDPATVNIYIMPRPSTNNVSLSVWEDAAQGFRFVTDVAGYATNPIPIAGYTFPWSNTWPHTLSFVEAPAAPLTASTFNCVNDGSGCQTEIDPTAGGPGTNQFTFNATAQADGNWPKTITAATTSTATITVNRILGSVDFQAPQGSQPGTAIVTVNVTINRGEQWLDYRDPATGVLSGIDIVDPAGFECSGKTGVLAGALSSFSSNDGGVTWRSTFTSTAGSFGWKCFHFKAKRTVGTKTYYSPESVLTVYIKAEDQPAEVCDKTRLGTVYKADANDPDHGTSIIAFPGQARLVKAEKAYCSDDGWYLDPDNNATDKATQLRFTQLPSAGTIATCSSAPCTIACNADGDCPFTYNPPATTGEAYFEYEVVTKNAVMNVLKTSPKGTGKFQIVNPPVPEAKNRTTTVLEDTGIPIGIASSDGLALKTLEEMNLRDGSDGYPWIVETAKVTSCNRDMRITPPVDILCDIVGSCNYSVPTQYDSTATTSCKWKAKINNTWSSEGTVTATITPVDDPPQTFANNVDAIAYANDVNRNDSFHRFSYHSMCWNRTDWFATFVNRATKVGLQGTGTSNLLGANTCLYEYGYLERDGDKAVEVQINTANRVGIASISAFACDANGRCKADVTPQTGFVGTASFEYKVKTCYGGNAALCSWQTSWSKYRLEVSNYDSKPVSKPGSSVVGQGGTAPIVFTYQGPPSDWDGITPPTEPGKYYKKTFRGSHYDNWWKTRHTKRVLTSDLVGASSVDFNCDWNTGVCVGLFVTAPGYTGEGGFTYSNRHSEGYTVYSADTGWGSSFNYGDELMVDSDPVRWDVTVKAAPIPTGLNLSTSVNQPITISLEMGDGQGYTHAEASPASSIIVKNEALAGGNLDNFTCDVAGKCSATYTPATDYEGTATFTYYVTDSQEPASYTSPISGNVTIQIQPAITLTNITRTSLEEGTTTILSLERQDYPATGVLVGEGYAHRDNSPAGSLTATDFVNGTLTGDGVTCSDGTCTVNCTADGDSDNDKCTFNFVPTNGTFFGLATFNYRLTVGTTVSEQKEVSLTYNARPTLKAEALNIEGVQGQNLTLDFEFNSNTSGEYGYTHPESGKATAITLSELTNIEQVGTPTCDAAGKCTVVVKHPTNGFGDTSFKYNVTVGGYQATSPRLVNVSFKEVPTAVASKSSSTDMNIIVEIPFDKGDEYTMSTDGKATRVVTSNPQNGETVDGNGSAKTDFTCDTNGTCTISFKPSTDYVGNNASFEFIVYNDTAASTVRTYSIRVDGSPESQARNMTGGVGGEPTAISITKDAGYTDPNNDSATQVEVQNVNNGTLSTISCDGAGICTGIFTPDRTFTGNATFEFRVTTEDSTRANVVKVSPWATFTLASEAADEAPVATGKTVNSADRSGQSVTIALDNGYTDANNDPASALTIQSSDGAITSTPSCNANGECTFNVTARLGSFGQSVVLYTVTTNGQTSNNGVLTLNYDNSPANGCINSLAWGSMTLSDSCGLTLAATASLDQCAVSSTDGVIRNISTGPVASNAGGMAATLTEFPTTTHKFTASWSVLTDLDDSGYLQRALKLTSSTPTALRASPLDNPPKRGQGINGLQVPVLGCTGTCEIANDASSSSLAVSAGGSITVGESFACSANGSGARCWGKNDFGQLGNGNQTDQSYASPVDTSTLNGAGIVALSAGNDFACALLSTGEVACWGRNHTGQLGDLTYTNRSTPAYVMRSSTTRLSNIVSIAAGDTHVCAVSASKAVWCWGDGSQGALGIADTANKNFAKPVKSSGNQGAPNLSNAVAVSSAGSTTCIVQDMGNEKKPLCWGRNDKGQLGHGDERNVTLDVTVDPDTEILTTAQAHGLSDGDTVTLAGTTTLPEGVAKESEVYFVKVIDEDELKLQAFADSSNSIDLTSQGEAVKINRVYPFPVPMKLNATTELTGVKGIALQKNASCVLMAEGTVRCVGDNTDGATGLNLNSGETDYPGLVRNSDNTGDINNVVSLSGGAAHTCALLSSAEVQCWGANASGQLGNQTTTNALIPVSAQNADSAVAVAAGGQTTCILQRSIENGNVHGRVKCWGSNTSGTLGNANNGANQTTIGDPVKLDASNLFEARYKECGTVFTVSDAP